MASRMFGQPPRRMFGPRQIVPVDLNDLMWSHDTLELTKQNINTHYSGSILQFLARFDDCEGLEGRVWQRYVIAYTESREFEVACLEDIVHARCLPLCSESATELLRAVDAEENAEDKRARQFKACGHDVDDVIEAWQVRALVRVAFFEHVLSDAVLRSGGPWHWVELVAHVNYSRVVTNDSIQVGATCANARDVFVKAGLIVAP